MKKEHALIKTLTKIPKSVFFFCFLINLSISSVLAADTYAQSTILTLQMNNKPIKEVFNYIEKNSEFVFVYLDNVIDSRKVVDVNLHNQPITVILDELFKGTDLTYKIDNRQILVKRKEAKESSFLSVQQTIDITGVVKDDVGEPVIGANILVKGTNNGVITDMEGRFSLKIPQANALLVVSYIGYISQEIQVGDKRSLTIILHTAT